MVRLLAIVALWAMVLSGGVQAVEMQTNFHYGEQVGFPPMEVPPAIYGGWGTPGWNCNAIGRVPVQSGLPAMYPTGCNPGGCNYCDGVWAGYQQRAFHKRINTRWYYGNHRAEPVGGGPIVGDSVPYDAAPNGIEAGTSSVIQTSPNAPRLAPTPATPEEVKPGQNDRPAPRTTTRPTKPLFRRGTSG
jgi:hypothetical protein